MNIQITDKIKDFYRNPIKLFGLVVILLSLVLFFCCKFHFPDYYTNRELAAQIAQTVEPEEVSHAVWHLLNPQYKIYNLIFQLWGLSVILFIFSVCFKLFEFKKFKELTFLNKKFFVYIWINVSYLIWSFAYVPSYMIDLKKYVYNWRADSMSIPLFDIIGTLAFFGILYYVAVNILSFITFNTKIKRTFYILLWGFVFLFWAFFAHDSFMRKFTYYNLILDLCYFISFIFISSLRSIS